MSTNNNIWVFLSHSNDDYDKVRTVRNILEGQQFRPIMFFLKCLNDDEEVDALIKREIDCRTRFILCDSENARKSKWVQKEVLYIKEQHRTFQTIDISKSEEEIARELMEFKTNATLFISCPREHWSFASELSERLRKYDFFVFFDNYTVYADEKFERNIQSAISDAAMNGIFVCIVGNATFDEWHGSNHELKCAIERNAKIIPIYIQDNLPNCELYNYLQRYDGFNVPSIDPVDETIKFILSKSYDVGSIHSLADDFKMGRNRDVDLNEEHLCRSLLEQMSSESETSDM